MQFLQSLKNEVEEYVPLEETGVEQVIVATENFSSLWGIPQVVLLTKIDKFCKAVQADLSKTFLVPEIEKLVDKVAEIVGLPRTNIIPIKNYECEVELRLDINILALLALRQILNFADDYLSNFLDD